MKERREGRGRLSGIDLLPPECGEALVWAAAELAKRERTQVEIYHEFHTKLTLLKMDFDGELEFAIPSFSAFNRFSIRKAILSRRMDETRQITGEIAGRFDAADSDNLTVIAAEAIKTLVFELLTDAGEAGLSPKHAMELASALRQASQAQNVSTNRRQTVEDEFKANVTAAVDRVAKLKGISSEASEQIKAMLLGVDAPVIEAVAESEQT